ncbi:uncharacterized protein LOC143026794 [Oratosquilla oratoria]|uniref:uncharacterized protein LOC143026794 n=1 Tax=Oratosquilla oratoria TaxID=337810 RepID=UPI003F77639E
MSAIMSGYVSPAALGSTWAGHVGYLPVNRALPTEREGRHSGKYSNSQIQQLLHLLPNNLRATPYPRPSTYRRRFTPPIPRTAGPTSTTPAPTPATSRMARFHSAPLESRQIPGDTASTAPEDDAIVFLVGMFNLMAIVVYTANKYLAGARAGELSNRMIQWQVQKVLDELVLKVHSSQYAAEMLSRAMPDDAPTMARSLSSSGDGRSSSNWSHDQVGRSSSSLGRHLASYNATDANYGTRTLQERWGAWLHKTKKLFPVLLSRSQDFNRVRLNPRIYEPIWNLYSSIFTQDLDRTLQDMAGSSLSSSSRGAEEDDQSRAFASTITLESALEALTKMDMKQVRALFAAITTLGRAHQRVDILSVLLDTLKDISETKDSQGEARVISEADSFTSTFMSKLTQALKLPSNYSSRRKPKPMEYESTTSTTSSMISRTTPTRAPPYRRQDTIARGGASTEAPQHFRRRMGTVEDDLEVASTNSHWTDRWFSLMTLASPVGLDMTTLYAKARSKPECLRGLLCRANKAWRKIGPIQASLTPFSSVVLSWALEDRTPHSLGDSLIAIRAGWMDKDCQHLYPECPQISKAHPAAKEAISFFSRLHRVAMQPTTTPQPTRAFYTQETTTMPLVPYRKESDHGAQDHMLSSHTKDHHTFVKNMNNTDRESLALQAFYDRYDGQGPMSVPGNTFSSSNYNSQDKYAKDESEAFQNILRRKDTIVNERPKLPYEKYDSPSIDNRDNAGSKISVSNSVSGMALQDRPTMITKPPWRRLFHHNDVPTQHDSQNRNETFAISHSEIKHSQTNIKPSLDKIGIPRKHQQDQQPAIFSLPAYSAYMASTFTNKKGLQHKPKENNRPMFPHKHKRPSLETSTSPPKSSPSPQTIAFPPTRYKYGLRRGLPAVNVAGYGTYNMGYNHGDGELYQHLKPWYTQRLRTPYPRPQGPRSTSIAPTTSTIVPNVLPSVTPDPLASKNVAPFGPEDAVTDVLRNELLYEYIRDQTKSTSQEETHGL